jgi:hypothetical protein
MDGQQSHKSSEKVFDLIQDLIQEETNRRLEKETNKMLEYHIKELGDLLNEMSKKAQEKANLPEIKVSATVIDLYCNKRSNEPMRCGYNITTYIHNKDKLIGCYSDIQYLPYKIRCTNYSDKSSFELFGPLQSISFIQGIKNSILDIYNILNPGVLTHMDNQYMHIRASVLMDLDKPIKENPEISKYSNEFIYNNGRSIIKMNWRVY